MKTSKLVLFIALACLTGCSQKIKNDASIGEAETKAYLTLADKLTQDMKQKFAGNMYQNETITPIETKDAITIGIPSSTTYSFKKDNSKFIKGDLNNDKLADLIICADLKEAQGQGPETKKYFVFLQNKDGYQYFYEYKADEMVDANCHKADLNIGIFNLDSIGNGLLIGNSDYQGNHEEFYRDYSYRCETEKYRLNIGTKELELVYQSDLLKKNKDTGKYEKVEVKK